MSRPASLRPDWDRLFEFAVAQEGHFASWQAAQAGYSPQLLQKHLNAGRIRHVRRGVYRLIHYPAGEHEDLVAHWLWSGQKGVFSHETALGLHGLSDALPAGIDLTLPEAWGARRLRVPPPLHLHFVDLSAGEREWVGPLPVTGVFRTLLDCAGGGVAPDLVEGAVRDALDRGLVDRSVIPRVRAAQRRSARAASTNGRSP